MIAKYIPERTENGYLARIQIELRRKKGEKHQLDYTYPRKFAEMNAALAKCFQLVSRWHKKYAPDADVIVEPPTIPQTRRVLRAASHGAFRTREF